MLLGRLAKKSITNFLVAVAALVVTAATVYKTFVEPGKETGRVAAARVAAVAAVSGAVASESEGGDAPAENRKYCVSGQQVYYVPQWAASCFDGTEPRTGGR